MAPSCNMLRAHRPHFIEFGEIYFAPIFPGVVKAWHKHNLMTLNYACGACPDASNWSSTTNAMGRRPGAS